MSMTDDVFNRYEIKRWIDGTVDGDGIIHISVWKKSYDSPTYAFSPDQLNPIIEWAKEEPGLYETLCVARDELIDMGIIVDKR